MNIKDYIASGILEEYVMGVTSEQETQEVKCMSHIYPEIKAELLKLEDALGQYARLYERKPSTTLKDKIFAQMEFNAHEESKESVEEESTASVVKVVPLWSKISIAAAILLGIYAGSLYYDNQQTKADMNALSARMTEVDKQNAVNQDFLAMYKNADMKIVKLSGKEISPESSVDVFWNQKSQEVALNVLNLPKPESGKQYQLWTIVDGVPVDMGMIDKDFQGKILKMKATAGKVIAFAITLEKEGGSPSPTLEKMYVMGLV